MGLALCVSFLIAALIGALIYRESAFAGIDARNLDLFGKYIGVANHVAPDKVVAHRGLIAESGAGVAAATDPLMLAGDVGRAFYLGYMDANAYDLKAIRAEEGRLPETETEMAVERSTLTALGWQAELGESLTFPISRGGQTVEVTYTLVGVLRDYIAQWQRLDGTKITLTYPPPGVVTVPTETPTLYAHVLCGRVSLEHELGGSYIENTFLVYKELTDGEKPIITGYLIPVLVFFTLLFVFAIHGVFSYTLRARQEYLTLLRCIGLSKRRGIRLFCLQGGALFLMAAPAGTAMGLLLGGAVAALSGLTGQLMPFTVRFGCLWPAWLLALCAILMASALPLGRFFRRGPLETDAVRPRKKRRPGPVPFTLPSVWKRAAKRVHRSQNAVTVLLAASCLFIAIIGCFWSLFAPRADYARTVWDAGEEAEDYVVHVYGGNSMPENFFISLPRGMGVSQQDLTLLEQVEDLRVNHALASGMTSHFFLLTEDDDNPYLQALAAGGSFLSEDQTPQVRKAIAQAGGGAGDLLVRPRILPITWDTLQNRRFLTLTDGILDKERFLRGVEIAAPNTFAIGDTFTLVTPLLADEDAPLGSDARFEFVIRQARVGATYDASVGDYIVLSAEHVMEIDPGARYTEVSLLHARKDDPEAVAHATALVAAVTARSNYTAMIDRIEERAVYTRQVRNGQIVTAVTVLVFLLAALLMFALSTRVKLRANLGSFVLMRALGARDETIRGLISYEALRLTLLGGLLGTLAGFGAALFVLRDYAYLPTGDIFMLMGLSALAVFGLILWLTHLSVQKPIQTLLHAVSAENLGAAAW
jgi:ABC-type lipoprotein release transport system permease subunit